MLEETRKPNEITARVASIDALRGFDMFWIIGGGWFFSSIKDVYEHPLTAGLAQQLEHVEWQGFRFEDLIFPLFLFIVGLVMPYSIARRLERGESRSRLYLHVIKRSVVLILLGLIYNGLLHFNFGEMRWPGVLQRIGLCYFLGALVVMHTSWRGQLLVVEIILLAYWAASMFIPVPEYGAGALTMKGCLSSYVDQLIIPGKLYYHYGDNEGLISTFPAVATTLIGALAGHWLRSFRSGNVKTAGLILAGVLCLLVGKKWDLSFPIIKIIWTSSYVLYAAGWSLLLLALFYWFIDVKGFAWWAFFFKVIGMNAIAIYFLSDVVDFAQIAKFFFQGLSEHVGRVKPLVLPFGVLLVKWIFLWFLYRHRAFIKV